MSVKLSNVQLRRFARDFKIAYKNCLRPFFPEMVKIKSGCMLMHLIQI